MAARVQEAIDNHDEWVRNEIRHALASNGRLHSYRFRHPEHLILRQFHAMRFACMFLHGCHEALIVVLANRLAAIAFYLLGHPDLLECMDIGFLNDYEYTFSVWRRFGIRLEPD